MRIENCDDLHADDIHVSVFLASILQRNHNFFWVDPPPSLRVLSGGVSVSAVAVSADGVVVTLRVSVTKGVNSLPLVSSVIRALSAVVFPYVGRLVGRLVVVGFPYVGRLVGRLVVVGFPYVGRLVGRLVVGFPYVGRLVG
jgi:hypothetical protein